MVGEMPVRGNVLVGKCPVGEVFFGELSVRGNVCRGFVLGEVSVGEVSGRETVLQSLKLRVIHKNVLMIRLFVA